MPVATCMHDSSFSLAEKGVNQSQSTADYRLMIHVLCDHELIVRLMRLNSKPRMCINRIVESKVQ